MGDFVGAVLKHLRKVPVEKLSLCGGFGKISKLAAGHMDLHSRIRVSTCHNWPNGPPRWVPTRPCRMRLSRQYQPAGAGHGQCSRHRPR